MNFRFWRRDDEPVEQRAITEVPWNAGGSSRPGVTESRALGLAAVYAANRHLADLISTLPLKSYRERGERREPMSYLPPLFRQLAADGRLGSWIFEAVTSLGLHGNAVGHVTHRDGMGYPLNVVWLPMNEITVDDTNSIRPVWYWKGRKLNSEALVHITWFKMPGRTLGLSPIEAYALTISNGLEAQEYGLSWFENGGFPPGTFRNENKTVSPIEAEEIRRRLVASIRKRQPLVHGSDWEYSPITVPPEQAQFIETMKMTANQIAAIYGINPTEIGGEAANSMTYSNEEMRQKRRMADANPWLRRLEEAFTSWLPERQYIKFNRDASEATDTKTRHEIYAIDRQIGLRSINELRALEDLPPIEGGDVVLPSSALALPAANNRGRSIEWSLTP